MRSWIATLSLFSAVTAAACGGTNGATPASPSPTAASGSAAAVSGTWTGTATDSSGTTMGMSMSSGMGMGMGSVGAMNWQITQTGSAFTGTVTFSNFHGSTTMTVSGTMNGKTGTFTMTMPNGSMPMTGCSGTVAGTFDMDDMMATMKGVYAGSTTCSGPFNNGQMTMTRR